MEKKEVLLNSGYQTRFYPKKDDFQFHEITNFLLASDLSNTAHFTKAKLKDIVNDTKAFYSYFFDSISPVLTIGTDISEVYHPNTSDKKIHVFEELDLLIKESSPFQIPIILSQNNIPFFGVLGRIAISSQNFKPYVPYIIASINISDPFTTYSPICYAHEIMHTQTDSRYGAITNYHNREILPIFIEKIMAYYKGIDLFHEIERARLSCLRDSICKPEEKLSDEDYIYYNSTLIAEALFDTYINSLDADKKVIMEYIQLIINGEITLEEFLDGFNITFEASVNTNAMKRNLHLE